MKQKLLALALLIIAMLAFHTLSSAATDPIVCTMEVSPSSLSEPGDVTVTITVSNAGDTDMTNPLTLFDPTSQVVTSFGDNGSVTLKAGEVKTWTGMWNVNQRTLENGQIVFFVKYTVVEEDGTSKSQSQPIRGKIEKANFTAQISVNRTIIPETAHEGQTINVVYDIANEGTVSLTNLTLAEHKDILADPLTIAAELPAGATAQVKLPVVMGKKDLTSKGTVTYTIADGTETQTFELEEQVITYGELAVLATLSSDAKGVMKDGTVKLTLELDNTGTVGFTDVRISDPTLGDVFTNQTIPAGEKLTLEKEITLTQSTDYTFEIHAIDNTGTEIIFFTNTLSLIAVDPNQALKLDITFSSNKSEVYSDLEVVRFTVTIFNNSTADAANVKVYQGDTEIYTFASIPAGETKTFSRDVTLRMAGKYQFRAETTDVLETPMTFESNILQIAFLQATPAPVTENPNITPTPEPTFVKATYPKISDPDIGTLPKLLRTFFYPMMIAGFGLFAVALVILVIATKKRADLRKTSENALDHLERSNHRDYVAASDGQEQPAEAKPAVDEEEKTPAAASDELLSEDELPHMKYVRNAYQLAGGEPAKGIEPDYAEDDHTWDSDQPQTRLEEESPYQRRTSRVSPYARQSADMDRENAPEQDDHTDEPT
ncbi:MAG: hypothetical protein ABIK64_00880 [Bacillota bacterium]